MSVAPMAIDRLSPARRPRRAAAGYQSWWDLLFLHWRVPASAFANLVPDSLVIDTFDGSAWIGIVAFRMTGIRPWWSPPVWGVSAFPETNVRTYVHFQGRDPGVWFLSLDAASSLGVMLGRWKWGLAYHRARMSVRRSGSRIRYESRRLWPGRGGVGGLLAAEIGDAHRGQETGSDVGHARPGSLEHFLIERYVLYCRKGTGNKLDRGRVHHAPYPLCEVRVLSCEQSWLSDFGLDLECRPDHAIYSPGVSTDIFSLEPVVPR